LLRHVVELAIHEQTDRLKERQIAIEAFHRKANFDNNSDPVVRVAAGEVRKRLAQYYSDPDIADEIRIVLPVGSYIPVFHFPNQSELILNTDPHISDDDAKLSPEVGAIADFAEPPRATIARTYPTRRLVRFAVVSLLVLGAAGIGTWRAVESSSDRSGFDSFWGPVLTSHNTPLISMGELRARQLSFASDPERNGRSDEFEIQIDDSASQGIPVERAAYSQAAALVASVFGAGNRTFEVLDQSDTTFADFSGRPTVLLGSYDNDWAIGISGGRRFQFKSDNKRGLRWIADQNRPGVEIGAMAISSLEPASYDAFSIVMRQTGQVSQQPHVLLAGVGDKGTLAAAKFVSDPKYLNDFAKRAPANWSKKNIEFLIRTRVIENVIGIPTIVDYSIW
jgi:hypothetical protein